MSEQHIKLPEGSIEKTTTTLNLGPTHPATHGVFQNILELDGERIDNLIAQLASLRSQLGEATAFVEQLHGQLAVLSGQEVPQERLARGGLILSGLPLDSTA